MRQPLYALDFCDVIVACLRSRREGAWNISGREKVDYIDLMRAVKRATGAGTRIVRIPYGLFRLLLQAYALVDRNPPFPTGQLAALSTPDRFEIIDCPAIFRVPPPPPAEALQPPHH